VAIDPAVITAVATIKIPVESLATETPAAAAATAKAATALADIAHLRPDTTGIDDLHLRLPALMDRTTLDPAERKRIKNAAAQRKSYESRRAKIKAELTKVLESEYLPGVNDQVRRRFRNALTRTDNLAQYHHEIRLMGTLLGRPGDVIAKLAHAPVRNIVNPGSQ
jgi:hypothetical protein